MADNDQNNDEYNFAELDSLDNESMSDLEAGADSMSTSHHQPVVKKDIRRNALIAIGLIIFLFIMYKFLGSIFSKKTQTASQPVIAPVSQVTPQPVQAVVVPTPQPVITQVDPDLKQKVSAMEIANQSMRAEVSSLTEQVNGINNNMNSLTEQMTKLNQLLTDLSSQVALQTQEINTLMARTQPKRAKPVARHVSPRVMYYIQAVIPGRAWLIGSNGSTLTVREGTKVAGYGVVKLIDSIQGRVLTSSGQVITFSQDDS